MHLHKNKLTALFTYLPAQYKKIVCKELKLEYSKSIGQKIRRVKIGEANDPIIMKALIKVAKRNEKLVKQNSQLLEAE